MAVTSLWKVKDNLERVLDYANNELKTENTDDLKNVIVYASNNQKTNHLVTGINCSPKHAYRQMMNSKHAAGKTDGILAFHGYQSFAEGEVDAVTCHELGVELAKRMWGDDFEVLVCTHTNTKHYHNHFVVNSVSWRTRKRFSNSKADYRRFRQLSDDICREHHLGVIENPLKGRMSYDEIKALFHGDPYIRGMVKADVELAINESRTYSQFKKYMISMGYEFDDSRKAHITVLTPDAKVHIRLDRINPKGTYTVEKIMERILDNEVIKWESVTDPKPPRRFHLNRVNSRKITGIRALYCHYLYLLGVLPKKGRRRRVPSALLSDLRRIDQYNEEIQIIVSKKINDRDHLSELISSSKNEIAQLEKERKRNYTRKDRTSSSEEAEIFAHKIESQTERITELRKDVNIYKRIDQHCETMKIKLKEINQQKEVEENERRSGQCRNNNKNVSRGN